MKKVINSIVLLIMLSVGMLSIEAYTCDFSNYGLKIQYDEAGTPEVIQTYYENSQDSVLKRWLVNTKSGEIITTNNLDRLDKKYIGYCPESIYTCAYEYTAYGNFTYPSTLQIPSIIGSEAGLGESMLYHEEKSIYLFSSEEEKKKDNTIGNLPNRELVKGNEFWDDIHAGYRWATKDDKNGWTIAGGILASILTTAHGISKTYIAPSTLYYEKYIDCSIVDYTGKRMTFNLACPHLQNYKDEMISAINEYSKCSNDMVCKSKTIANVNSKEDNLKNYCKSILKEQSFDGGTEEQCIRDCINISAQIRSMKKEAGLVSENPSECGFSHRLIVWINNILKWIKYFLPVIVIILGILDFIKAIGTDKDDQMKKAQGKFVKRLIAAALTFIIPLIIVFVLEKMGFTAEGCGIIEI